MTARRRPSSAATGSFPSCILSGQWDPLCLGKPLRAAWAGMLWACCEAKSAPGPSTQTQAASVNSSRLICSSGLFAFGEAPRAGGWESLEDTAWEFERALRGHLDLLLETPRDAKAQGGRGRRRLAGDG